jgi:hypothetical protein
VCALALRPATLVSIQDFGGSGGNVAAGKRWCLVFRLRAGAHPLICSLRAQTAGTAGRDRMIPGTQDSEDDRTRSACG